MITALILICIAYLVGSIPFGYLIVRAKVRDDVRESGSGGTGATNVTRRAGKLAGLLTLLLDAAKGIVAVALVKWVLGSSEGNLVVALSGIAAIVGHCFPIWLGFRGGKGVATAVGVLLFLAPWCMAAAALVFIAVVSATRYVSLGSIVATIAFPLLILTQHYLVKPIYGLRFVMLAAVGAGLIIIVRHQANIDRLFRGTETKITRR